MSIRLAAHLDRAIEGVDTVLLRRARSGDTGTMERVLFGIATNRGVAVRWMEPEPGGRAQVYERDYRMVESADRVEAYFAVDRVMLGGTGHVVEAAWARDIPVYAFSVEADGSIERVGELEPDQ